MAFMSARGYDNIAMRFFLLIFASVLVALPGAASPKEAHPNKMIEASDNWGMYFSNMGGHPAMTVFDDGISERIGKIELPNSIKVKLYLHEVRDDGLPTSEEGERLMQIGPIVEDAISQNGGLFLGRVTTNSVRWNIGLAPQDTSAIERALVQSSTKHDFRYDIFIDSDPNKSAYWEDLYPTNDDRQVMADMDAKRALSENGDNQYAERPVDHWAYFNNRDDAERFARWSVQQGYLDVEVSSQKEGILARTNWLVRMNHIGTVLLNDITHHTVKLSNQAREHGGTYDGWETQVTN
ncbi:MAG: DUF695 domain-containing protein [Henriciella sp.]|nr:DUF695 domain-containing protein [Henriciella sp.]